jgi:signal transduction histidine kinase
MGRGKQEAATLAAEAPMMQRPPMDASRRNRSGSRSARAGTDPVARLAHALRTPLNAVLGFSELMAAARFGPHGNARYAEYSALIHRGAEEMLAMIDALARILQLRDRSWPSDRGKVDPAMLARDAVARVLPRAAGRGQRVALAVARDVRPRRLDGALVGEALGALLVNAVDFSPDGATIEMRVGPGRGASLRFEVRDRGVGIAPGDLAHVATPFVQLRPGGVPGSAGHGLGLALADAIAAREGASLGLARRRGGGIVASLSWPRGRRGRSAR